MLFGCIRFIILLLYSKSNLYPNTKGGGKTAETISTNQQLVLKWDKPPPLFKTLSHSLRQSPHSPHSERTQSFGQRKVHSLDLFGRSWPQSWIENPRSFKQFIRKGIGHDADGDPDRTQFFGFDEDAQISGFQPGVYTSIEGTWIILYFTIFRTFAINICTILATRGCFFAWLVECHRVLTPFRKFPSRMKYCLLGCRYSYFKEKATF